jgi:hypothetical protein
MWPRPRSTWRCAQAATGEVSYTGVGFKPKALKARVVNHIVDAANRIRVFFLR